MDLLLSLVSRKKKYFFFQTILRSRIAATDKIFKTDSIFHYMLNVDHSSGPLQSKILHFEDKLTNELLSKKQSSLPQHNKHAILALHARFT